MSDTTLIEYAMAQNVPVEEIERLINKQAEQDYHASLSRFRCECPTIYKTEQSLADTISVIADTLMAHGFSFCWIPAVNQENGMITVVCKLVHEHGHSEFSPLSALPDNNPDLSPAQALQSTISHLERVTLCAALGIAAKEKEKDAEAEPESPQSIPLITKVQADELEALYSEAGGDHDLLVRPFTSGTEFKDLPHWAYPIVKQKLQERING